MYAYLQGNSIYIHGSALIQDLLITLEFRDATISFHTAQCDLGLSSLYKLYICIQY